MKKILMTLLLFVVVIGSGNVDGTAYDGYVTHLPIITRAGNRWLGPDGGRPVAMAVDPANPATVYAGSWGAGMFKSLDGGVTWLPTNQGLGNLFINSLVIDPTQPQVLYAGTYRNQVYKSIDGGQSWFWSGSGMQESAIVYTMAFDPQNTNTLFAGTRGISNNGRPPWNGVLYKSTDAGQTWRAVLQNVGGLEAQDWVYSVTVNPQEPKYAYAALHEHGVYRTTNYGESWVSYTAGLDTDDDRTGRAILVDWELPYPYRIYYGAWRGNGVYLSLDNGDGWGTLNDGIIGIAVYGLTISPQDAATIYLSTFSVGILRTTDRGENWLPRGLSKDGIYAVAVNPQNDAILYAGTAGDGLYRSLDEGATWQHSQSGFRNADVTSLVLAGTSRQLYTSLFGGGVFTSPDGGATWAEISTGLTDKFILQLVVDPSRPNLIYALTTNGGLFRYDTLTGTGWVFVGEDLPLSTNPQPVFPADDPRASRETLLNEPAPSANGLEGLPEADTLTTMVYAPSNPNIVYIGTSGSGVYKSLNGGRDWFFSGLEFSVINSLAVDPLNANKVYAITNNNGIVRFSQDGGGSWGSLESSYVSAAYSLALATDGSGALYMGTSLGVLRYTSTTGWSLAGLSGAAVPVVITDRNHPGLIIAGTDNGAYFSEDSGTTWTYGPQELAGQTVQSITFDPLQPQVVYFGTKLRGILQAFLDLSE